MNSYKKVLIVVVTLIISAGIFSSGFYFGYQKGPEVEKVSNIFNKEQAVVADIDFEPFWKVWNIINEKYVSSDGPTDQEKVWGAIAGLSSSLGDPYTIFLPPKELEIFESDINGEFQGVGMEIGIRDNILTVVAPLKDTPAYKAGILAGDKIIEIDNQISADMPIDEAVRLIRGEKGTTVLLTILRENNGKTLEPLEIAIIRDVINIPTIDTEKTEEGIFIIRLYSFSANSTGLFTDALQEFVDSGSDKLILDLRNNPGGFLEASVDMASWFLPKGVVVVREDAGKKRKERDYRSKGYNIFNDNLKFAILVNAGSASASEILAGALSEHGIATLVGEKTFGKGSVQELVKVGPDSSLKITVARWLTPNGVSISEQGLKPDVEVKMTREDIIKESDPQLEKAIEVLLNK